MESKRREELSEINAVNGERMHLEGQRECSDKPYGFFSLLFRSFDSSKKTVCQPERNKMLVVLHNK